MRKPPRIVIESVRKTLFLISLVARTTIMDRNFEKMKKKLNNEHHKLFGFAIINPEDSNTTARLFSSFVQPRLKILSLKS